MFQPGSNLYTQGFGSRPEGVEVPHLDVRAPNTTDVLYPIGKRWINSTNNGNSILTSQSSSAGVTSSNWVSQVASSGLTAAMSGTPGAVTVSNSSVTSTSIIIFSRATTGGTPGNVSITAQSSGSFTLTSTGNETSTFNYIVLN